MYVYISTPLYTCTLKISIHRSFKASAKLEKLLFVLKCFLAPKAKGSPPLAAEQQGILVAPALAAFLGGEEVGQKPASSVCLFLSLWYYYQASLSSLHGSHLSSYLNLLCILQ